MPVGADDAGITDSDMWDLAESTMIKVNSHCDYLHAATLTSSSEEALPGKVIQE